MDLAAGGAQHALRRQTCCTAGARTVRLMQVIDWRTSLLWRVAWSVTNHRMKRIRSEWASMVAGLDLHARKLAIDTFQVIHAHALTCAITHSGCRCEYAVAKRHWRLGLVGFPSRTRAVLSFGCVGSSALQPNHRPCALQMIESRMDGTSDGVHHYSTKHYLLGGSTSKFPMQLMSNFLCYDEIAEEIAALRHAETEQTLSDEAEDPLSPRSA